MTDSASESGVDESAFGLGGETSQQADVDAATNDDTDTDSAAPAADTGSADEDVADSQTADVNAGYDDPSDSPVSDSTFPATDDDGTPQ